MTGGDKIIKGLESAIGDAKGDSRLTGEAFWTYDREVGAWYVGLEGRSPAPYTEQRRVEAILDIADDGTLAGIELLDAPGPNE